jgi:hypothetical protein
MIHRFDLAAFVAATSFAAAAHAAPSVTEYTMPYPTSPTPSAIDILNSTTACYIDSAGPGVGILDTSVPTQTFWTFSSSTLSEEGIKCSGSTYVFAADTTNDEIIYINRTGTPTAYHDSLSSWVSGGPYALTRTGSSTDSVWFSTYTTTANQTVYIGLFTPGLGGTDSVDLYALPSAVAEPGDVIEGLAWTGVGDTYIGFSVYGTNHKTANMLDLTPGGGGGTYTITTWAWPSTSATQVAIDSNGALYSAAGSGSDRAFRWNFFAGTAVDNIDANFTFSSYISPDMIWTGSVSGTGQSLITLAGVSSAAVTTSTHSATKASHSPTNTSFGSHGGHAVSAPPPPLSPTSTAGTKFNYTGAITSNTADRITTIATNHFFTERASGIVALYAP